MENKEFLVIGGESDGQRLMLPKDMVTISLPVPNKSYHEVYERKQLYAGGKVYYIFLYAGLNESDMIRLMIENYHYKDGKENG